MAPSKLYQSSNLQMWSTSKVWFRLVAGHCRIAVDCSNAENYHRLQEIHNRSLRLIQTAAISSGKCRRLQKTHASDAAICGKIEKILISKKKFAVSCGRLNEPLVWTSLKIEHLLQPPLPVSSVSSSWAELLMQLGKTFVVGAELHQLGNIAAPLVGIVGVRVTPGRRGFLPVIVSSEISQQIIMKFSSTNYYNTCANKALIV